MTTFYCPTYFCNFCEREFEVGNRYHNEEEAFDKAKELMYHKAVHICDNGHIGVGVFTGFERWISVTNNTWEKIGHMLGHILAATLVICAWLIIIVFTLKVIWFILFRILL